MESCGVADVAGSKATVAEFKSVLGDLAAVCSTLEPADLLASDAGRLVELAGAIERQVAGARTLAVFRVLESGIWKDEGARSPQRWLAAKLGITEAQAARIEATDERVQDQART
jgi:hypothetical protein